MSKVFRLVQLLVCVGLISTFIGCAATPKRESTGQFVDDSVITTKAKAAIFDESSLKIFQINVKTFKGVVQLSGFVDSSNSVRRAGEVVARVDGVKSIQNDLIVK